MLIFAIAYKADLGKTMPAIFLFAVTAQLDSTEINLAILTLGGVVLCLGLFSGFFKERLFISDPIIALFVGVLLGPLILHVIDLNHWGQPEGILEQAARIAIAIQLMGTALRLPKAYPFKHIGIVGILLGLVMPLMWIISGLLVYFIVGLPFGVSMLIGGAIAPTDPVLATSVVTGKIAEENLPERIRYTLSTESAANDGAAYPFVFLPILILTKPPEIAFTEWLIKTVIWEVGGAIIIGGILGYLAGRIFVWAEHKNTTEKQSFLTYTVSLSLVILGLLKLLKTDGILAVFVGGILFSWVVSGKERSEEAKVHEAVDRFFTLYIFVLLGLVLPWQQWLSLGWRGMGLLVAVLLLRRLPVLLLVRPFLGNLKAIQDIVFMGWFGPIGAAAIFYAFLSQRYTGLNSLWPVISLIICGSILIHGITAIPLTQWYGKHYQR